MARPLDLVVPDGLAKLLRTDPGEAVGFTVQVLSTDRDGWPAVAIVSAGELALGGEGDRLLLALWPSSSAVANITRSERATLTFVLDGTSYVVRAVARRLEDLEVPGGGQLACFALTIAGATADEAPYAKLTAGIRYELDDEPATVERWRAVRSLLAERA